MYSLFSLDVVFVQHSAKYIGQTFRLFQMFVPTSELQSQLETRIFRQSSLIERRVTESYFR